MNPSFSLAGPAEIIRAKQKDDSYSDKLQRLWLDILLKGSGTRLWLQLRKIPVGHILYGAATTLSGLQTLGEEYTGIVQINSSCTTIPTVMSRLSMVILDNFGSIVFICVLDKLEKVVKQSTSLQTEAKQHTLEAIKILKASLYFLDRIHKTLFYCGGVYYQISKRITGIHYVLVRRWLKDYQSLYFFKILGIVTSIHLIGVAVHVTYKWLMSPHEADRQLPEKPISTQSSERKCPLCLEERKGVSATPCGHLFCWTCILDWLQTQNQCPICREIVEPSRVIPLQNYV